MNLTTTSGYDASTLISVGVVAFLMGCVAYHYYLQWGSRHRFEHLCLKILLEGPLRPWKWKFIRRGVRRSLWANIQHILVHSKVSEQPPEVLNAARDRAWEEVLRVADVEVSKMKVWEPGEPIPLIVFSVAWEHNDHIFEIRGPEPDHVKSGMIGPSDLLLRIQSKEDAIKEANGDNIESASGVDSP